MEYSDSLPQLNFTLPDRVYLHCKRNSERKKTQHKKFSSKLKNFEISSFFPQNFRGHRKFGKNDKIFHSKVIE